jgi:transposase
MSRKLHLQMHFELDELEKFYKECKDYVEKPRWQMIWLVAKGMNAIEVGEIMGVGPDWVRTLVKRYNKNGAEGLRDRRKDNKGRAFLLNKEQQERLREALKGEPTNGGLWSGPKVAKWIEKEIGRKVGRQRGWDYLKRLGLTLRRPRRRHSEANEDEQEYFSKIMNCPTK